MPFPTVPMAVIKKVAQQRVYKRVRGELREMYENKHLQDWEIIDDDDIWKHVQKIQNLLKDDEDEIERAIHGGARGAHA